MADKPWYQDGLHFGCSGCGNCCTGAPGYVWITNREIQKMAEHLQVDIQQFEQQYVRKIGIRKSLIELPESNFDCVFFDNQTRGCNIYEVRPLQCQTWPFWQSNLKDQQAWKQTCEFCPGSGQGDFVPLEEIERQKAIVKV